MPADNDSPPAEPLRRRWLTASVYAGPTKMGQPPDRKARRLPCVGDRVGGLGVRPPR
jgi:hypothetical protein